VGAATLRLSAADMAELEAAVPAHEARARLTVTRGSSLVGCCAWRDAWAWFACVYVTWPSFMPVLYNEMYVCYSSLHSQQDN
jgi:hypothetical protein